MNKNSYGITSYQREFTINKLKYQQKYLYENCIDLGSVQIPYANFFKNAWHNSNRYIAELNHRVYSLNEYAKEKDLTPIFAVITLPSEYHRYKQVKIKGKTRFVKNRKFIDDENHSVKSGNKKLQEIVRNIFFKRAFRNIPKDMKCYITTREPHRDGTPHLNLLVFVPKDKINSCIEAIKECLISEQNEVQTSINNPTAYIMKYIFKTLDDLRGNSDNLDKLSNLTLWYIHHKIPRVTMSRTFISLDIYRALGGRYDIKTLTYMYKNKMLQVFVDNKNKVVEIFDDVGQIYNRKRYFKLTSYLHKQKPSLKKYNNPNYIEIEDKDGNIIDYIHHSNIVNPRRFVNQMRDLELYDYFKNLDIDTVNLHHYAYTNNELAKRDFLGFEKVSLNHFNTEFDVEDYEDELINAI